MAMFLTGTTVSSVVAESPDPATASDRRSPPPALCDRAVVEAVFVNCAEEGASPVTQVDIAAELEHFN